MELWMVLLSIVLGGLGIYLYIFFSNDVFRKTGIPRLTRYPFVGSMGGFFIRRKALPDMIQEFYDKNTEAKYISFYDFGTPVLFIRDPEIIKSVGVKNFEHFPNHREIFETSSDPLFSKALFTLQGDKWKEMRALLSPAFTSSKMKMMFKLTTRCAENFAEYWAKESNNLDCVDMKDTFTRYTTDVIATCAFGIEVDSIRNRDNEFFTLGKKISNFNTWQLIQILVGRICPPIAKLLGFRFFSSRAILFFQGVIESTIRVREEQGITRPDMIQLMLDSKDKKLTLEEMTAQAFIFFLGGFETTSVLMCFAAQEIALNPDIQAKLQKEIDEVLKENSGVLTYEALHKMEYLDAVINETLRLWPASVFTDRMCAKDCELEPALPNCKPFTVKKGMTLWIPTFSIHRDKKYYEDPEKFIPERFLGENKKDIDSATFLAFGIGPRFCIGNRFALMETKAVLFHLLSRCNLKPCKKTVYPVIFSNKTMIAPEGGFWLKIEPRSS